MSRLIPNADNTHTKILKCKTMYSDNSDEEVEETREQMHRIEINKAKKGATMGLSQQIGDDLDRIARN